jgi:hypothetical protein
MRKKKWKKFVVVVVVVVVVTVVVSALFRHIPSPRALIGHVFSTLTQPTESFLLKRYCIRVNQI